MWGQTHTRCRFVLNLLEFLLAFFGILIYYGCPRHRYEILRASKFVVAISICRAVFRGKLWPPLGLICLPHLGFRSPAGVATLLDTVVLTGGLAHGISPVGVKSPKLDLQILLVTKSCDFFIKFGDAFWIELASTWLFFGKSRSQVSL